MAYFKYADKNVYYREMGAGSPIILLHGNSVSSNMFSGIEELFLHDHKVILIDFLGHGKSDRLEQFPADFWYDQAMQVIELITANGYGKVSIIGTSGGALTALNVAMERGDLVHRVIADSLEGEEAVSFWIGTIREEREKTKNLEQMRMLWEYCHGTDWEKVVDNDTDVMVRHAETIRRFFHKDLAQIQVPVLLSASLADDEFSQIMDIEKTYNQMLRKLPNGKLHLFPTGGHPAMLTNAEEFAVMANEFLNAK